jgi:hypothetical protein
MFNAMIRVLGMGSCEFDNKTNPTLVALNGVDNIPC